MTPEDLANRTPGRPRDVQAGRQILHAAQDLLAEVGVHGLSVEQVAERAAVGKATIYRRWPSKDDLILAAIQDLYDDMTVSDTGDVEADLRATLRAALRLVTETRAGQILPQLAGELARRTPYGQAYLDTVMGPRFDILRNVLRRGISDGTLRADLDVQLATASTVGTLVVLSLTGEVSTADSELPDRLVDQLLDGWRA